MSEHTAGKTHDVRGSMRVYSVGLCYASVCACGLTVEEVTAGLNASHPTGISSQWQLSESNFASGQSNPCPCDQYPETHQHYLFDC